QTLTALRQFGKIVEAKHSPMEWPQLKPTAWLIMECYPESPHLSPEELAKLPDRARRNYQEGSVPGPLSEKSFGKLVAAIGDRREGAFFRYALAGWVSVDEDISPELNNSQKEQLFDTYLSVVSDPQSPELVRRECGDIATRLLQREHRRIIYSDDAVKDLMRTGTPERRRALDTLLASGEISLTAKTRERLAPWRQRATEFQKVLVRVKDDEREPQSLKDQATKSLAWLAHSLLLRDSDPAAKRPKD
ncbi:MAG: hypothetical protein ABFC96_13120, partial [Thermoguttaceae bacterium]